MNLKNQNIENYNNLKKKLTTQINYNKKLLALYEGVSGFRHDFNNIISTIGGYIKTDDISGLKLYYSDLQNDCFKLNSLSTLNPNLINSPGIYNLLCSKYNKACDLAISMNLEIFTSFKNVNIKTYILSRILGILIDNSIEASKDCFNKIINISFKNDYNNKYKIITISNTFNNNSINTTEIFNKGKTSKDNHLGIGLWEVKQYLNKNEQLELKTKIDNDFFTQELKIYNKKE